MSVKNLQTPEEIAKLLNIDRYTITYLARKGLLPCVRIGKNYRFSIQEVARHLEIETVPEVMEYMDRSFGEEEPAS